MENKTTTNEHYKNCRAVCITTPQPPVVSPSTLPKNFFLLMPLLTLVDIPLFYIPRLFLFLQLFIVSVALSLSRCFASIVLGVSALLWCATTLLASPWFQPCNSLILTLTNLTPFVICLTHRNERKNKTWKNIIGRCKQKAIPHPEAFNFCTNPDFHPLVSELPSCRPETSYPCDNISSPVIKNALAWVIERNLQHTFVIAAKLG